MQGNINHHQSQIYGDPSINIGVSSLPDLKFLPYPNGMFQDDKIAYMNNLVICSQSLFIPTYGYYPCTPMFPVITNNIQNSPFSIQSSPIQINEKQVDDHHRFQAQN